MSDVLVDLLDPTEDELRRVAPATVHPSAVRNMVTPRHPEREVRPRLVNHGDYVFGLLIVPMDIRGGELAYQEVDVLLDRGHIVVVRRTPEHGAPYDAGSLHRYCQRPHVSPGLALFHLFDEIAERYLDLVDEVNEEIDEIEDQVDTLGNRELRDRLSRLRHDVLHLRRTLAPTRDAARSVLDGRLDLENPAGSEELFPRDVELRFADTYDKLLRAVDGLDLSRDLIAGVRDYHQAKISIDQNEVMKRLTIVSSLLLPPTFIVGLYGQNFVELPELRWHLGYLFSWLLILASTLGQIVYFRRRGWM